MKRIQTLLAAGALLAALTPARAIETAGTRQQAWQWVAHYYENPQPEQFVPAVYALSRSDYFETVGQPATAIGFFAAVFAENPQRVTRWLDDTAALPERHRRILAAAAWTAGHPEGARRLRELSARSDATLQREIAAMLERGPTPLADTPVLSASSMNLQWGAFLASGDERHIVNVLAALGSERPGVASSARFALAQNAAAHPRVLEICRAQLEKQPAAVRAELRAALRDAVTTRPGGA
jgi:hypothetical protein